MLMNYTLYNSNQLCFSTKVLFRETAIYVLYIYTLYKSLNSCDGSTYYQAYSNKLAQIFNDNIDTQNKIHMQVGDVKEKKLTVDVRLSFVCLRDE